MDFIEKIFIFVILILLVIILGIHLYVIVGIFLDKHIHGKREIGKSEKRRGDFEK